MVLFLELDGTIYGPVELSDVVQDLVLCVQVHTHCLRVP